MSERITPDERQEFERRIEQSRREAAASQSEAAVYRRLLEEIYKAANEASAQKNVNLLHTMTHLHHFDIPSEHDLKQYGRDMWHSWQRDAGWLKMAKASLEKIQAEAERLYSDDAAQMKIKQTILNEARNGLITHL